MLDCTSLVQHIHDPIHEKGHTLDLIITSSSDRIISLRPVADELFSDHFSISCTLSLPNTQLQIKEVNIRPKNFDLQPFLDDLASSDLCLNPPDDPDVLFDSYNSTLRVIYEHHAPSRKKTTTARCLVPWFNKSIKNSSKREGRLSRSGATHVILTTYHISIRKETTSLMNHERREYYSEFINQNNHDKRKLFTNAKKLFGMHQQHLLPPNSTSGTLSQDFADFFTMKVVNIQM